MDGPQPVTLIDQALADASQTRAIEFGPGVVARTGALLRRLFGDRAVLLIADENTDAAAGAAVRASLRQADVELAAEPLVFPAKPTLSSDYHHVEAVRERLRELPDAAPCSIAAGTLNDITKLAAGELGREYVNVCTAASVDGYSASGASITRDGFKITRDCPAPVGLVADTDIMAAAPARLSATGYGDLIEKIPAGADWILADALGIEPIDAEVWELCQSPLRAALAQPELVAVGDPAAITKLAECNILSGLAMQAYGSSRPASGAGHQFSHMWEMEGHGQAWEPPLSHGFKVGIGTLAVCALWERVLRLDFDSLDVDAIVAAAPTPADVEDNVRILLGGRMLEPALAASLAKHVDGDRLRERVLRVQQIWPRLRARLEAQLLPARVVADMLARAGAPDNPESIGITPDHLRRTFFTAGLIRTRYTVLDLLADLGLLEPVVDRMFTRPLN